MSRHRNYVFTINNPDGTLDFDPSVVKACWYQLERGDNGTPHYQGYIEFHTPKSLSAVKLVPGLSRAHLEVRRGSRLQAIAYAQKEDTRVEGPYTFGDTENVCAVANQGKRNDIKAFKEAVEGGLEKEEAFDQYPQIVAKYPRFFKEVYERHYLKSLEKTRFVPRPGWQWELTLILEAEPSKRTVHWYYDQTGNSGKSTFALAREDAFVVTGGKHEDVYYTYDRQPVVIFDWPRAKRDSFPYPVVESFKNGYFLSTKYECRAMRFKVPHVIIFANFEPNREELSADRWVVHVI